MTAIEPPADPAAIDVIGRVCHAANRAFQQAVGDAHPSSEQPEDWEREATAAGVRRVLAGATPERLHADWCDLKYRDGWRHGPLKDPVAKTHPCLVPYARLPEVERRKDALFHAIVLALAGP